MPTKVSDLPISQSWKRTDVDARRVRNKIIRRRLAICFGTLAVLAGSAGITWALIVVAYPDFVAHTDGQPVKPANLSSVAPNGEISRHMHAGDARPAPMEDGTHANATLALLAADDAATPNSNATGRHSMDLVLVEKDENGTFVERSLRFDDEVYEYLARHPEVLGASAAQPPATRRLGPHGEDSRREVGKAEAESMPKSPVVRLRGVRTWYGATSGFCSGTLVDNDVVLTAAHCVYRWGGFREFEVEVHPWNAALEPFAPSTWDSGHPSCAIRPRITYPCGVRMCSGLWGIRYPCGINFCTRYGPSLPDCTWTYSTRYMIVPEEWKATDCGSGGESSCASSDFQHDIALVKLHSNEGRHAGERAGVLTPVHTNTYDATYTITGYPGDRRPFMATASGPIDSVNNNLLRHQIDANKGQSGSGVTAGTGVYGVHVCGGGSSDCARRIDGWWLNVLRSHF